MLRYSIITTCLTCLALNSFSQSNTVAAGGNASSSAGSVSFTVGQIDYISQSGSGGNLNQGVQQPFEISSTDGIYDQNFSISLTIGPNPTSDILILSSTIALEDDFHFYLFDLNGKTIIEKTKLSHYEEISLAHLPVGIYNLIVKDSEKEIKLFKIIKN